MYVCTWILYMHLCMIHTYYVHAHAELNVINMQNLKIWSGTCNYVHVVAKSESKPLSYYFKVSWYLSEH